MSSTIQKTTSLSVFLLCVVFFRYANCQLDEDQMLELHTSWMSDFNRSYTSLEEKALRYFNFKENFNKINSINTQQLGFSLGINQFSDLSPEEFINRYLGYKQPIQPLTTAKEQNFSIANLQAVSSPVSIDWRSLGAVNPVKNQQSCGSCWAFSAVAAIEGIVQIKSGKLLSLSEQQLVECDTYNSGCDGGWMPNAFRWVINNQGINTAENYPYIGTNEACDQAKADVSAVKISSYTTLPSNNEDLLATAVSKQPVSVAVEAKGYHFQYYKSGIFSGPCGYDLDHAVTIVGYGASVGGTEFWILRNSWGTRWGENGYMRMLKGYKDSRGLCGIAMKPSYPNAQDQPVSVDSNEGSRLYIQSSLFSHFMLWFTISLCLTILFGK